MRPGLTVQESRLHSFGTVMMDPVVVIDRRWAITVTPLDVVQQRRVAAVNHAVEGGNISETVRVFGVSRRTIHGWKKLAETHHIDARK